MSLAIVLGLALSVGAVHAQTVSEPTTTTSGSDAATSDASQAKPAKAHARSLDQVQVTGTLLNSAQIQTATPTYTITAQDIKARGFNSVSEVLQSSVFATGSVQGPATSGGFTQGAQTVSLYGLNPEYTLTLVDGKPISQFGQLYNGQSNFTNISNIPLSMIDHIDIIPGGGSSIYGSAAIAGTINIVTKQHMDGAEVLARFGGMSEGGGASQRLAFSFGKQFGKFNILGAVEFDNSNPVWAYQRAMTRYTQRPTTVATILDYGTIDQYTGGILGYVSPPDNCGAMSGQFGGTTVVAHSANAKRTGVYCGSRSADGYTTFANQSRSYNGMLKMRYDVNDHLRLYSDAMLDWQQQKWTPGSSYMWWGPADLSGGQGYIEDASNQHILYPDRVFSPEEVGNDYYNNMGRQNDLMYQADIGANGTFGDSDWNWDVYYMRSGDVTQTDSPFRMAGPVDSFFSNRLGQKVGVDPNTGLDMYNLNLQQFYSPLTPGQVASFMQNVGGFSSTFVNDTRGTITNDSLFHLPGGDAGFAWLLEGGSQGWTQPVNPLITAGDVWGQAATAGAGTRRHLASAFELNLPLIKQLTLDLSGRYDRYGITDPTTGDGVNNGKFTWKAGLEYRPFSTLLLRANYATAFLAPDMSSLFLGPSGSYQNITDYYLCQKNYGGGACTEPDVNYEVSGTTTANSKLKPTTAKSWTAGFVWSPLQGLSFQADFLHIAISNEVAVQDSDLLMRQESQCRLGTLDKNSPDCLAALSQVTRSSLTDQVTSIQSYYINMSNEVTDSVTSELKYAFPHTAIGDFGAQVDYNVMLKHNYQEYAGSLPINQLANPLFSSEFKSIVSGALSWSLHGRWNSTLYWHRYGASPNYKAMTAGYGTPGAGYLKPWITFNWSVGYSPTKNLDLTLMVNNLMNKMPPRDGTYSSFPFYNVYNYNVMGRQIMAQADYRFGL